MKLVCEDHDRTTIMALEGDFTTDSVDAFKRAVTERLSDAGHDFVLVAEQVSFIDSAGLESLLWLQDEAAQHLGQVRLVRPTENLSTILSITRLCHQFDVHQEITEAIRSLK
ncbi:MAG: anti-sigma factor antagonist [Planctomycetes bacterium]|nr:anti-sigma factor antagonist [Planctomycetota bacterium]NOG54103.1 STAS domain-containing protein [Planctomycetota bacterium]